MIRTMIVDDEENIRYGLKRQVESLNLDIQVIALVDNGEVALEAVQKYHPELLFMDINMPGMNGLEVIKKIRELQHMCSIIIISGYDDFQFAKEAIRQKVDFYLLKPVDDDELAEVCAQAIDNYQKRLLEHNLLKQYQPNDSADLLAYIQNHLDDPTLDYDSLQNSFGLSRSSISKLIKQATNQSLSEYITNQRIDLADAYLKNQKNAAIKQIALMCGFTDPLYFSRVYKKIRGRTPNSTREENL